MAVQQLFYTSCKKGLSSGMGFQTYSMSKGITDKERMEIESHCIYIPPSNLPTQPTKEEIDRLFPISFSSFRLENGKYCISQIKYVGKDYSERYGNYFCHVLISNDAWKFYPIELYKSPVFRYCLSEEEKNAVEIDYLPEITEIPLGNVVDFDEISNFLKGSGGDRGKKFTSLLERVVMYNSSRKRTILADVKENIPFWIGAVCMSLPKKLALQFSFTTYSYNPDNTDYILCGISKNGSKFNFADNRKMYEYSAMNFSEDCPRSKSSFSKRAEVGYTVSKEVFLPFLKFLDQFEYNKLDEEVDNCVTLYNIVKKGLEKCSIEDVKKALSFAIKYKSEEAYEELFHQINARLKKISTQVDVQLCYMITTFLLKASRDIGDENYIVRAYKFFFDSLDYIAIYSKDTDIYEMLNLRKKMAQDEMDNISQFLEVSLSPDRIKNIQNDIKENPVYYSISTISDIIYSGYTFKDKNVTLLLNNCIKFLIGSEDNTLYVLNYFKNDCECISKIIIRIYCINYYLGRSQAILDLLAKFVVDEGNKDGNWKKKVYLNIYNLPNSYNFLFSLYVFELKENIENRDFFVNYCSEIFNSFEEYRSEKFSDAFKLYLEFYHGDDASLESYKSILNYIIENLNIHIVDKKVMEKFITDVEEKLNIDNAGEENALIETILKLKRKYNITTICNISELLYIGKRIENPDMDYDEKLLKKVKYNFSYMSEEKYREYLSWLLPNILVQSSGFTGHIKVKKTFFCSKYEDTFYNVYVNGIEEILFTKKYKNLMGSRYNERYKIFLDFFITLYKNKKNLSEERENIIYNRVIEILIKISQKKLKEYTAYIVDKTSKLKNQVYIREKWLEIEKEAEGRGKKKGILDLFKK
ncbi:hypothetical protein [Clostridium sp. AWRP]|uniref:GAP1-N2 domain-containing protein n=1 Tax=Clostridium sp. AWRP TaxID=2212991 RepID=UPI000FD996ED|nr:hypothetical protein [Clostridium sp. AWRP]AZV55578.1 hypothetical protein DMR38_02575 [Clostridium sp. AWRP]